MNQRRLGRRRLLWLAGTALGGAALAAPATLGLAWPLPARASGAATLQSALVESNLIYVTPLQSNGRESACQAEVWFVADGDSAYVVTASDAWRARAVQRGLTRARLWVGEAGVWSDSAGAYRGLPRMEAEAALIEDRAEHARVLELFGAKYALEWLIWGRRFRNGLADGSRVMVRYRSAP